MQIIMVTINGEMFLFNNIISNQEYNSLQELADNNQFRESLNFEDAASVQMKFIDAVKKHLGICLEPIKISYIVRIQ